MYAHRKHEGRGSRLRRTLSGLLVTGLAVTTVTAAGGPAAADSVALGDEHVLEIPGVAPQILNLPFVCLRRNAEPPQCSVKQAATPGTAATTVRLVWSLVGETSGMNRSLASGFPADCGGGKGVELAVSSSGGNAQVAVAAYLTERNVAVPGAPPDEEPTEQELINEAIGFDGSPNAIALSVCFPS